MPVLPPKVRIGFRTYSILELPHGATSDDGLDLLGRHDWKGTIEISPHYLPEEVINSVWHECLHGMCDVYNLGYDDEAEEYFCQQMAPIFTAFVRDNPQLIAWMLNTVHDSKKNGFQESA